MLKDSEKRIWQRYETESNSVRFHGNILKLYRKPGVYFKEGEVDVFFSPSPAEFN